MSEDDGLSDSPGHSASSQEFAAYCALEFEHRRNSGADFDEQQYRDAMKLVIDKLRRLEGGRS